MIRGRLPMSTSMPAPAPSTSSSTVKIVMAISVVLAIAAFVHFDFGRLLSLTALKENRDRLLAFTEANYALAAVLFVIIYIIVTGLSLPGAVILTLAGGFLFGGFLGTVFVNLGATTGATLAFL